MATSSLQQKPYNNYFVSENDLKYVPPYFRDTPETTTEVSCVTKGVWPEWVNGTFVRIGAGKFTIPTSEDGSKPNAVLQHFFDGLGILHKFTMSNGQVRYTSRHTAEGVIRKAQKDGFISTTMFGVNANTPSLKNAQDPCSALLGAQQSLFAPKGHLPPDGANINVVPRRGMHLPKDTNPLSRGVASGNPEEEEILVHTDFIMLQVCNAKTLEPKRLLTYADIDAELSGFGICAHPPKDRERGHTYNYLISQTGVMSIFALDIVSKPAKLVWKTALPCKPCYIHSMAMTQEYVVFIRNPLHMDVSDTTKQVMEMIEFEADAQTLFFVLNKSDGKHIATYAAPNFMFFHSVNAYNYTDKTTGDVNIHVDLCSYESDFVPYREYSLSNVVDPAQPFQDGTLVRYELAAINNANTNTVARATVAQAIPGVALELPRISKYMSMNPSYRYVYATGGNGGASPGTEVPIGRLGNGVKVVQAAFFSSIVKTDWQTGKFLRWQPENGESCPCEPVFVARPGAEDEDDGIVLTIIIDKKGTHSILVALHGRDLKEVARADMPQVYGIGAHGSFIEARGMY
ncbi:Beta,beta-carotene 9',10'-oxygenase [Lachnellula willkommii]|uniref:Beta,beta-carotene 9',10'-oxygenase n=1 Tax=Lachnellula willkommii TaxID=215461 RepID=A0A559MIF5_9HELO|nr:Beta,beta-carotene 9',10'-oxygenase [Lachnellula willkommii]